ncbi:hypothetical protein BB560_000295 [Smittium megazygosporum]|uniref:Fcf2 pre-rRNA processing C-terminal domain-containing protein n=1 Tax=Smittium megazygosporum TaxID=133381 RepID=A0A2T9ZKQ2_9FUNG|nr:hypothetical protein BB560_000295 [Smittium megazygosporum]
MSNPTLDQLLKEARSALSNTHQSLPKENSDSSSVLSKSSVISLLNRYSEKTSGLNENSAISLNKSDSAVNVSFNNEKLASTRSEDPLKNKRRDPTIRPPHKSVQKKDKQETTGPKWFDMKAPQITEEIKRDLHVLKMRNVLDPKRFYKRDSKRSEIPKYFQFGTIIEGPTEFYSARLTRKQRKATIVEELMADSNSRQYYKRKYSEIQKNLQSGGKNFYRKLQKKR